MNQQQHRAALAAAVLLGLFTVAAAYIGRHDVPLPLAPGPAPSPAQYALTVHSEDGCGWCAKLHAEMQKPEARAALERFAVSEVKDQFPALSGHGYPYMVVADAAGKQLAKHEGYMDAHALAAWLDGFR